MKKIYSNPILFSILYMILFFLVIKFLYFIFSDNTNYKLEIFYYTSFILLSSLILNKTDIKIGINFKLKDFIFYIPLIAIILITNYKHISFEIFHKSQLPLFIFFLFTLVTFLSAMFEELTFRVLIIGLIAKKINNHRYKSYLSVLYSSLIFGFAHIIHFLLVDENSLSGLDNVIYAAFSVGFLFGAIYLKTNNFYIIGILHFFLNYFKKAGTINSISKIASTINTNYTTFEYIMSKLIALVIFGIPLFIGIYILSFVNESDIKRLYKY